MNIHEALKTLEFDYELADDDVLLDAILVARVGKMDGSATTMLEVSSEGIDSVVQYGLAKGLGSLLDGRWRESQRPHDG